LLVRQALREAAIASRDAVIAIEQVWGNVKSKELANLCADTIGEVSAAATKGLRRIRRDAPLCFTFLRHTGLRL
jgi:hypothetical protein